MSGVRSRQEKLFEFMAHVVMILLVVMAVAPFLLMLSGSLTENNVLNRYGYQFWPKEFSLDAYAYIVNEWEQIGRAYIVTIVVTLVGTTFSLFLVSTAAYAMSQKNIPGLRIISLLILLTLLFNGGAVSSYIIWTNIFHIKNTFAALIVPNLMLNGFNLILVRNYMQNSIPGELMEAAEIDGAGVFGVYLKIVMPLSKPILATVGLLTGLGYWNDWTNGLYYITDNKYYSIQLLLNQMNNNIQFLASHSDQLGTVQQNVPGTSMRMAIAVIGVLPILILYPFFQKYFEKGITIGAVKG